jgi:predicted transcriptional regulator of viral defense system
MPKLDPTYVPRTLSSREAELIGWLEAERRRTVSSREVAATFHWSEPTVWSLLSGLSHKGWLKRVGHGHYEVLLAETGGFAPPDPWPALSQWSRPYYVGFRSAAYEQGLTPDRPALIQVPVPMGVTRPLAWKQFPIRLIHVRDFSGEGVMISKVGEWPVKMASTEKVLLDGAAVPSRMGGAVELARVVARARSKVDWQSLVKIAASVSWGTVALRRLGAILTRLGVEGSPELAAAVAQLPGRRILLGQASVHGTKGPLIKPWNVVDNVGERLLTEVGR